MLILPGLYRLELKLFPFRYIHTAVYCMHMHTSACLLDHRKGLGQVRSPDQRGKEITARMGAGEYARKGQLRVGRLEASIPVSPGDTKGPRGLSCPTAPLPSPAGGTQQMSAQGDRVENEESGRVRRSPAAAQARSLSALLSAAAAGPRGAGGSPGGRRRG